MTTKGQVKKDNENNKNYGTSSMVVINMINALDKKGIKAELEKEYQTCFYLNLKKNGYDISHMKFDKIPMSFKKFAECIDDMFKNIEKIKILNGEP